MFKRIILHRSAFFVAGTVVMMVFLLGAANKLEAIYKIQPYSNVILGVLALFAIWLYANGVTRTLDGQIANLALIERNANSAYQRLSEYYDGQAGNPQFYKWQGLIRVIADDLDHISHNILQINRGLGLAKDEHTEPEFKKFEQELESIKRDIGEALNRRNETYEELIRNKVAPQEPDFMSIFEIMSSDMFKAYKVFDEILSRSHTNKKLWLYLNDIRNYLGAAWARATTDFGDTVKEILPGNHLVMIQDIQSASENLEALIRKVEPYEHQEVINVEKNLSDERHSKQKKKQIAI